MGRLNQGYGPARWRWWLSSGFEPYEASAWWWAAFSCRIHSFFINLKKYRTYISEKWPRLITHKSTNCLPAEWRCCDFLSQGQILFSGDESNTVTNGKNICETKNTPDVTVNIHTAIAGCLIQFSSMKKDHVSWSFCFVKFDHCIAHYINVTFHGIGRFLIHFSYLNIWNSETHSFSNRRWVLWALNPSFSSRSLIFWAKSLTFRLSLLYLNDRAMYTISM